MRQMHFSVDDTLECLLWLTDNSDKVNSIFDSPVFRFAKEIHDRYGLGVSFYCMFTNGELSLEAVLDKWKNEFQENAEWLKFGFHAYKMNSNYNDASREQITWEFEKVMEQLIRITGGGECITDVIRLHFCSGNSEVRSELVKHGVKVLLCADDDRINYGLSKDENEAVLTQGYYIDVEMNCIYVRTYIRVEEVENMEETIKSYHHTPFITIFTHEKWMKDKEAKEMIRGLLDGFTQ